jgi:phosphodiesterase/alkaline phosphatase D-like protein
MMKKILIYITVGLLATVSSSCSDYLDKEVDLTLSEEQIFSKYENTPSITTPTNGANNLTPYVAFVSNAFSTNVAGQTHASSDWQVATDSGFTTVVKSVTNDVTNKTAWTITDGLPSNTTYYARVRYKSNGGYLSNWSTTIILSTKAYYVATPSITSPVGGATNLGPTVTITTSAFSSDVTGETHTSTDWQLSTASDFSSIAFQSLDNTTNKTSWTTPDLVAGTTYYARVRFKGSSSL